MKYTTKSKVENYLNKTLTIAEIENFILYAEGYIDSFTGRNFRSESSVRYYDGNNQPYLFINECTSISKVEIDRGSGYTEMTDWEVVESKKPDFPIWKIGSKNSYFTRGNGNVKVTAMWGYSENPPQDIVFIATKLAGDFYNSRGTEGRKTREKIGDYEVGHSDKNKVDEISIRILNNYKALTI